MIFNSIDFLIFFCAVCAAYFFIPDRFKWVYLLTASFFYYGYKNPVFLAFLVIPVIIVYFISLEITRISPTPGSKKRRKLFLVAGLISALGALLVLRYTDFIGSTLFSILGAKYKFVDFFVPIGLSFYSFKMVSYLLDVYNEKMPAEKHFGYFALYVSFFPQILAGPIDRAINFIPELKKKISFDMHRITEGFQLVVWGIFKKMVIADRLGLFVNEMFLNPRKQGLNLLMAAYFYAFQIYCDFSAYTDIATGISKILGFKSMLNFDFPYSSKSITQFWSKWHISLSTWLRDYLFLPIAYAVMRPIRSEKLLKIKTETWGYMIGMLLTMFLAGLWHGPSWTFVAWGTLHGLYLVVGYLTKKTRKKFVKKIRLNKIPWLRRFISVFITFNLVSFAWIFFRAESFSKAFTYIKYIQFKHPGNATAYMLFNLIMVIIFIFLEIMYKNRGNINFLKHIPATVKIAGLALFICLIIIFAVDKTNEFIYFKF
jgi:alginate O-acetyltransferase complex protein AlgI